MESDLHGNQQKVQLVTKIGNLETDKIELEEVLKKEVIKNEKLESMLELLKRINEEKLEGIGFLSYQGKSRVDTIIDAAHIFEENKELQDMLNSKEEYLREFNDITQDLETQLLEMRTKNQQIVGYKMQADQKIIELKRQDLVNLKAAEEFREQAEFLGVQVSTEKRRREELRAQLDCCREAVSLFIASADDITEVMNFLSGDLLL